MTFLRHCRNAILWSVAGTAMDYYVLTHSVPAWLILPAFGAVAILTGTTLAGRVRIVAQ